MSTEPEPILRPRMPELDTLRGVAILLVLFYHGFGLEYGLEGLSGASRWFVAATQYGWVGVDLFFVLSGFLITGILLDTKGRPHYYRRFYIRRALRILPIYYATLLAVVIVTRTGLVAQYVPWSFLTISFFFLANFVTWFRIYAGYAVLWSLAVEEHFYLAWPTVVHRLSGYGVAMCAAAICVTCPTLRAICFVLKRGGGWTDYGAFTWLVADGLATGSLLAIALRGSLNRREVIRRLGIAAVLITIALAFAGKPFGLLSRERLLGAALRQTTLNIFFLGVLVLALLAGSGRKNWIFFKPLMMLGEISYGVYLIHTLIFWLVDRGVDIFFPYLPPFTGHFTWMAARFAVALGATIAIAYGSRWFFEERFLRMKEKLGG
jgi:peptidoglycan/LPS O-acetylase OafA/YrhL